MVPVLQVGGGQTPQGWITSQSKGGPVPASASAVRISDPPPRGGGNEISGHAVPRLDAPRLWPGARRPWRSAWGWGGEDGRPPEGFVVGGPRPSGVGSGWVGAAGESWPLRSPRWTGWMGSVCQCGQGGGCLGASSTSHVGGQTWERVRRAGLGRGGWASGPQTAFPGVPQGSFALELLTPCPPANPPKPAGALF